MFTFALTILFVIIVLAILQPAMPTVPYTVFQLLLSHDGDSTMIHDSSCSEFFSRSQAVALIGKTVHTNAGCSVVVVGIECYGPDDYQLVGSDDYSYAQCCKNGLYAWAV